MMNVKKMMGKNLSLPVSSSSSDPQAYKDDLQRPYMTRNDAFAVLLVMFNKAALSSYRFPCANVITLFQMVCSCSFLYTMRRWKIISFTAGASPQSIGNDPIALVPLETLAHTLPLAISYLLYMLVSMESIRGVNIPMYTTIRRTTVAFTLVMEYFLVGQTHSPSVVGSVGTIILGAIIAGAGDLSFDSYSYAVVFMSNLCTAENPVASIVLVLCGAMVKLSVQNLIISAFIGPLQNFAFFLPGIICTPILLVWTFVSCDLKVTANFSYLQSPGFQAVMVLSCILAFFLNYFIFLNTTLNSALTQTICGNLKDLFTIGLGWLLIGGLPFDHLLNLVGQSLGFLGSCLYAYCKIKGK